MFEPQNDSNRQLVMDSDQSMINQEFEYTSKLPVIRHVRKVISQGSPVQRRVSPRLKYIPESKRPYYRPSRRDLSECSSEQKNQENVNANHSTNDTSPNVSREKDVDKDCERVVDRSETKGLPNCTFQKVRDQGSGSDAAVFNGVACFAAGDNGNIDSKVGNSKWLDGCNSSLNADDKSARAQRRFSPRLKKIPESKRPYYGTSRRDSSKCSNDQNNQENVNANYNTQESSSNVSREKDTGKKRKSEVDHSETIGSPTYSFEKVRDQGSGSDAAIFDGVRCSVAGNNGNIGSKVGNSKWLDVCNSSLDGSSVNTQRRFSPRLKSIPENKRPYYGPFEKVSGQGSGTDAAMFNGVTCFVAGNNENIDSKVGNSKCFHVYNPSPNADRESAYAQRRFSPRLKNIPESKRPYYGASQRDSPQFSNDKNNQENVNANHSTQDNSLTVSRDRHVDKEYKKSEVDCSETKGLPNCIFEKVSDQGFGSDAAIIDGFTCSTAGNNGNIDSKVGNSKRLDNCNSSSNADGKSAYVQRRFSPRLKTIPESERPYYGTSQRALSQCSNDKNNQENVNANHSTQESSPNVSRDRDIAKECKSEVDNSETKGLPNCGFEKVWDRVSGSDEAIFNGVMCSAAGSNGHIHSKLENSKWSDDYNSSPNADGGKGAHARVKHTLINDNRHYLHFVQEKEKRCKKGEVNDRTVAKGLKHKVVRFWPTKGAFGFVAYKNHLRRLERRQPKLTNPQVYFTQARGLKASSKLHGLVSEDISGGQEDVPIPATNLIDDAPVAPTGFTYSKSIQVAENIKLPPNACGCKCKGNCMNAKACACARLNGSDFPYVLRNGGRLIEAKDVVFECGPNCGCGLGCINRISQQGIKYQLEVFRTPEKGWAVRSRDFIPSGAPVCEYIGVLRRTDELDNVAENDYIFEIDCLHTMKEIGGRERRLGDASGPISNHLEKIDDRALDSTPEFCIDAGSVGNVARFINHSCEPNLFVQCVLSMHHDVRLARVVLFAAEKIAPFQELTYDYGYALDSVIGPDGKIKELLCRCGMADCRKRLY
ncbi:uncharacterized protein LOC114261527 isoform X1 [Camellia sinensis]|uniref:uncharacterized protein LOC114261527 isoform X1 n=1 Tax=Camellia sinensis TaxID=4442 RepID=UPI001035B57D|nr:uncharacterized protein LOC114261527 isoform X1 [Camellia sinensis]XP_028057596.1 uncharacterized protein LOC114261527 isoform X1 [Camellia sinensis]